MSEQLETLRRQGARRWWLLGTAFVAVVAFAVVFAAASGADLTGSTFESTDGNLIVDTAGHSDWKNVAGLRTSIDQPSGSSDNSFGQGTKEDDPSVTIVDGSIPDNKNDLTRSYLASETVGVQTFLYLAWERAANAGSANLDFELNQNATTGWDGSTTGALTINRTEGDLLFTYDFGGSGSPTLGLNFWLTTDNGHSGSDCTKANSLPCWGNHITLSPSGTPAADGAVNAATITDDVTSPAVGSLAAGLFGEAAINLSLVPGVFSANTCKAFGSEFVKSRASGSSVDAELKDFIAPVLIHVSNCGSIELKKNWVGTGSNATLNIGTTSGAHDTAQTAVGPSGGTTGAKTVENGSYWVGEDLSDPGNYTSSLDCTDNGNAVAHGTNPLPVTGGHAVVCTFTNTRNPHLTLQKNVVNDNGGTATASQWTLSASASGDPNNFSGAGPTQGHNVTAGVAYTLAESGGSSAYTASSWSCTGGSQNGNAITLSSAQDVTCTITNDDNAPSLHLIKTVTNDNGGTAAATDWTLTATGTGGSPSNLSGSTPVNSGAGFKADTYTLGESGPSGYTASSWSCTGGTQSGSTITVALGQSATCTIVNNDNAPSLHLIKTVTNDNGGTAVATAWTLHADGTGNAPSNLSGTTPVSSGASFNADTYTLAESGPSGYTASSWSCVVTGTQTPVSVTNAKVAIGLGQDVTCTIVNNDNAPSLHLHKTVTNDNGGTAAATDWTLTATGSGEGATNLSGSTPVNSDPTFKVGTYALAETGPTGYTAGSWSCDGGTQEGSSITVGLGQDVTCTIVNNDNGPSLHLRKTVTNDNGGTAEATDWALTATGSGEGATNLSGPTPVDSGATFKAGTYTLAESGGPSDYTASNWSCEGGTQDGNKITVGLGDDVTCTINNDDDAPTVTIEKRVLPSSDTGTFKFTLTQGESQTVLDNGTDGYGDGDHTGQVDVSTGALGISESGNGSTDGSKYASSWSCSSNRERSASGAGTSISLAGLQLGENVTCTFTNTRLATLIVKKVVDNSNGGGTKGPGDFTIHVTTAGLDVSGSPAAGSGPGTSYTLLPGTYKVSEGAVSGYNLTNIAGCLADGSVTLDAGATVTCTLTNTSNAPPPPPPPPPPAPKVDLQITKSAAPNPATLGNQVTWTMVVTNNGPNNATAVTLADPVPAGMTFVSVSSSQGTCTGGAIVSCTLGNLNVGASVTITLVTTAGATGTIVNTATTVAKEPETNTANNTASASVVVQGKFVPPAVFCTAVKVAPQTLFVGRKTTLTIRISQNGKPVKGIRIKIKGSTLNLTTKASNAKGMVTVKVNPKKAGIVTIVPVSHKGCTNPRIGVTGVFTPPVTG